MFIAQTLKPDADDSHQIVQWHIGDDLAARFPPQILDCEYQGADGSLFGTDAFIQQLNIFTGIDSKLQ
jgi:hypothetical protein